MFFLYAFVACNPWQEIHDRELMWYDKERIETDLGIELMTLQRGGPLGYNHRLVIHRNGMSFDNHAWFLSLPDTFFLDQSYAPNRSELIYMQRGLLNQQNNFITLENGHLPALQKWNGRYSKVPGRVPCA